MCETISFGEITVTFAFLFEIRSNDHSRPTCQTSENETFDHLIAAFIAIFATFNCTELFNQLY